MDPDAPFHVVVGVDSSDHAQHAALWAAREAYDRHGRLTVAHALELPENAARRHEPSEQTASRREQGQALVTRVAATISAGHPGLPVGTEVSDDAPTRALSILSLDAGLLVTGEAHEGATVPALCGAARGARLLVVGSRRDCGGPRSSPGHTVQGLLSQAETPVAVVPTH